MSADLLTEDNLLPTGQNFVCVSFLKDPENKTSTSGIKIRGVFDKIDEAQNKSEERLSGEKMFGNSSSNLANFFNGEIIDLDE